MLYYDFKTIPSVLMTGKTAEKHGWSHDGRVNEHNLVVIFHSGECVFSMLNKSFRFRGGDVAIVPKGTFYKPRTTSECEYTFFHFDGDFFEGASPSPTQPTYGQIYGKLAPADFSLPFDYKMSVFEQSVEVEMLLAKCVNAPLSAGETVPLLLSTYLVEMLALISKANFGKFSRPSYPAAVNRILAYAGENYLGKFSLSEMCNKLGVSKQYCMRVFKAHLNKTVIEYVTELKMNHAVYLLRWTYMNVSEVADYLGFSDPAYFSRVFRKHHGLPPSAYLD